MAELIKTIHIIYLFFLTFSIIFFTQQFLNNLISTVTFIKVFGFSVGFIFILMITFKNSRKYFILAIQDMGVREKVAVPILMFIFLGGFSIALAITLIAFIEALGILFVVESLTSLLLNVIALLSFFWVAFVLFMGWDYIKIAGMVSQYSMIRKNERVSFWKSMKIFFRKANSIRDAFFAFTAVDLGCKDFSRSAKIYYKNLIFPVKIWAACMILYENKYLTDALEEAFSYFKEKQIKMFYSSKLASFFLPMMIVPIGLSLGIIISNIEYFSNPVCFTSSCFFVVIFFLIFMSLGFFFSYSISISLESAYYVKMLNDIKNDKIPNKTEAADRRIIFIEEETIRRISKLKGNIWDVFRIYL